MEQRAPRTREPQASQMDWINPTESTSPVEQVQAKQEVGSGGAAATNKAEMYAKRAQGPIEQRSSPAKQDVYTKKQFDSDIAKFKQSAKKAGASYDEIQRKVKLRTNAYEKNYGDPKKVTTIKGKDGSYKVNK